MFQLSKEETKALRNYLLLPYLKRVLEIDTKWVNHSKMKLPRPYLELIHAAITLASSDLKWAKAMLHDRGIRVYIEDTKEDVVICKVYCRGYNQTYRYSSIQIRNQVERRILAYFLADDRLKKRNIPSV
ncbi:hypothetical protein IQ283_03650 [Alkalihalobacillus hwajinpoensis]|uniref:hypothetical protein n=1 Tax=Guptibacillus hwajinpoensis TaxID=208199 RepID=UPI0018846650|nr:hypothetical protein [Pseudalkalibacillus hwajinpoensis]MBF0705691.1 hypothetical protein [Pseudalkalibacillus hwajinpoensis]